jgi:hypothetical protein
MRRKCWHDGPGDGWGPAARQEPDLAYGEAPDLK